MKSQRINVYARFVTDETQASDPVRTAGAKARRVGRGTQAVPARSPKQGLKKQAGLPK